MFMDLVIFGRQKYTQQTHWCLNRVLLTFRWLLKRQKLQNYQVQIKSQQNWLNQEVEQFAMRSINLLYVFGIKMNCLRSERSRSLYLSIRRAIKQNIVVIGAYHFCQLCTKSYPTSCSQGWLHTQSKLLGIISVEFDAIDHIFCIYKYLRKNGNKTKKFISSL